MHTQLCISIATKTISLDEEAYERLRARKQERESFSDVVKQLAGERSWRDVAGIWEGSMDDIEDSIEEGRERSRRRSDRVADELDGRTE